MNAKARIFLSYAREDRAAVDELYRRLAARPNLKPWMDVRDIRPGTRWEDVIFKAIKESDLMCICLSRHTYNNNGFILREIREALFRVEELNEQARRAALLAGQSWREIIFLIPVRLENCEMPEDLQSFQYVDLFAARGWQRLLKTIREELKERRPAVAMPPSQP